MRPIIESRLLQYVVALAEELSFTRASKRLYVAQSALSKQIADLERSLEVKLFDRSTRQVTLTLAGMAFIEEARAALAHSERAIQIAKEVARGDRRPLSIGFSPHYNFDLLKKIKTQSERHFGANEIVFTSSLTRDQIRSVSDGIFDAGLCFSPIEHPDLETVALWKEPVGVVVTSAHPLVKKNVLNVRHKDLECETVILFSRKINPGFSRELEQFWSGLNFRPKATQDVSTIAEALALVAAGTGIAFIKSSLRNMLPPSLKMLDLSPQEKLTVEMGVLYRKEDRTARTNDFLRLVCGRSTIQSSSRRKR